MLIRSTWVVQIRQTFELCSKLGGRRGVRAHHDSLGESDLHDPDRPSPVNV